MKHNGHITQTQNNTADIGEGFSSSSGMTSFQADYYKRMEPATRSPATGFNETAIRHIFVQKAFAIKRSGTSFRYNKFFSDGGVVDVDEHELVTAGQMADYLMRPTLGLMDIQVGPVMGTSDQNMYGYFSSTSSYVEGSGIFVKPNETVFQQTSLIGKLKYIFDRLLNNDGTAAGFKIHADEFWGGALNIGSTTSSNVSCVNLSAGTNSSYANPIFQVIGQNGSNIRQILINKNNNDSSDKPVGIAGQYEGSEDFDDYLSYSHASLLNKFTFVDVDRYYFRDVVNGNHSPSGKMAWMCGNESATGDGIDWIDFNYSYNGTALDRTIVRIKKPASKEAVSYLLQSYSGYEQDISLFKLTAPSSTFNFTFKARTSSVLTGGTTGIVLQGLGISTPKSYVFRILDNGVLSIRNGTSTSSTYDLRIPFISSPTSPSDYNILTSEGEQKIRNTIDSTYRPYTTFTNSSDSTYVSNGVTSNGTYCQYNLYVYGGHGLGFGHYVKTPRLGGNSDFLITNPYAAQNISSVGLKINNFNVATEDNFIKYLNVSADISGIANGSTSFDIKKIDIDTGNNTYSSTSTYTLTDDSGVAKIIFNRNGVYEIYFNTTFEQWSTDGMAAPYQAKIKTSLDEYIQQNVTYNMPTSFNGKFIMRMTVSEYVKFSFSDTIPALSASNKRTQILIRRLSD